MRKLVVGSLALGLATLGWGAASFGQKVPAPRGEIRIVDKNPTNWAWVTLNVMEHLMEVDKDGKWVPRLATTWRWQLYAANKAVNFVPYVNTSLTLAETSVTDQHWSVRKAGAKP